MLFFAIQRRLVFIFLLPLTAGFILYFWIRSSTEQSSHFWHFRGKTSVRTPWHRPRQNTCCKVRCFLNFSYEMCYFNSPVIFYFSQIAAFGKVRYTLYFWSTHIIFCWRNLIKVMKQKEGKKTIACHAGLFIHRETTQSVCEPMVLLLVNWINDLPFASPI